MATRLNRYFLELENRQIRIPAGRWHDWLSKGWLKVIGKRIAKPAKPGLFGTEAGNLRTPEEPRAPWMSLNCRIIERHSTYDLRGPVLKPEQLRRIIWAAYGD